MGKSVKLRAETITQNTTKTEKIYSGWLAQNIGSAPCSVYGVQLLPGEGLNSQSIVQMTADDIWTEPIDITVQPGGAIRLLRAQAAPAVISGKEIGGCKR